MTVQTQKNRIVHEAIQDQTNFVYDFVVYEEEHMYVSLNFEEYFLPYTVTGTSNPAGGEVILSEPVNAGDQVTLYRLMPVTQEIDYKRYDAFPAETHERGLDKLTLLVQQVTDWGIGSIRFPLAEAYGPNSVLPPVGERSLKFMFFDADGGVTVSDGTAIGGEGIKTLSLRADGWTPNLVGIDSADSENVVFHIQEPNLPNRLVTLDGAGKIPPGALPFVEFEGLDITADSQVMLRSDNDTNPARPAVGVQMPVNSPLSLIQLDAAGKIPPELINIAGLRNLGLFRGDDLCDKLGDDPGECIVPDHRNPSERFPEVAHLYQGGDYFIFTMLPPEVSGSVNLFSQAGEAAPAPVVVDPGDGCIYFEEFSDPLGGGVLIEEGWYYVEDIISGSSAELVAYDPTGDVIIQPADINVHLALKRLDDRALDKEAGGTVIGPITHATVPSIDGHVTNKLYVDQAVGAIDLDIQGLQTQIDANVQSIVQLEADVQLKVGFQDYATETTSGVIKLRVSGNDCFITTTDINP